MKGIIYTRVSSDEQVKGTSLDTQEEACLEYCKSKGIEVVKIFRDEGESAKTLDRKEFLNAIDFCQRNKGKLDAFIVYKLDRFSRNAEAHFEVKALLSKANVTLHSVTEPIGTDPSQKLFETILAGFAEFDNAIRRVRCMNGMSAKLKQGLWPWKAPVGYICQSFKKQGLKKIEADKPHPVIFPILQKALKQYATGLYSQADIAKLLEIEGLPALVGKKKISLQYVANILGKQLPFYAGLLPNPWPDKKEDDRFLPGLHAPMISQEEMLKIQMVRSGKKVSYKWNRHNDTFPLRRTVLCAECLRPLTGSTPRGNGGSYHYYHCYNPECKLRSKFIPKSEIEKEFLKHLVSITPNKEFLEAFKETVIDEWKTQGSEFEFKAEQFKVHLDVLEKQRKRVYEMREEGIYTNKDFQERRDEIDGKIATTKISLSEARMEQFDIESAVNYAVEQISNLPRFWVELPPDLKAQFQKRVFPEGTLFVRGKGFRTTKLGFIYELNKRKRTSKSTVVDPTGLEPATPSLQMMCSTR